MAIKQHGGQPTMQGPAIYRIRVSGRVDARWADQLWGMQITHPIRSRGTTETVLIGQLADQSALNGVLRALYERHLPVISVECLEGEEPE
jgi:hypothetical protein